MARKWVGQFNLRLRKGKKRSARNRKSSRRIGRRLKIRARQRKPLLKGLKLPNSKKKTRRSLKGRRTSKILLAIKLPRRKRERKMRKMRRKGNPIKLFSLLCKGFFKNGRMKKKNV